MAWGTLKEIYTHKCMIILKHRYLYYVLSDNEISDGAYDKLEKELEQFEKDHPELKHPDTPSETVGSSNPETYPDSIRRLYRDRTIKKRTRSNIKKIKKETKVKKRMPALF